MQGKSRDEGPMFELQVAPRQTRASLGLHMHRLPHISFLRGTCNVTL